MELNENELKELIEDVLVKMKKIEANIDAYYEIPDEEKTLNNLLAHLSVITSKYTNLIVGLTNMSVITNLPPVKTHTNHNGDLPEMYI